MADKKIVVNCTTGEVQELELTAEELTQREADRVAHEIEQAELESKAKADAVAKTAILAKIGITEEELKIALG